MKRWLLFFVACVALILTVAASAAPTKRADCTWGASSVVVEQVNGQLVQSEPSTSGCIP